MTDDMHISALLIVSIAASSLTFSLRGVLMGFLSQSLTYVLIGTMFSVLFLPQELQYVISAMPLTYSSECIRSAALERAFPFGSLAAVAAFGTAFFPACYYMLVKGKI